jgi:hypothetical protein
MDAKPKKSPSDGWSTTTSGSSSSTLETPILPETIYACWLGLLIRVCTSAAKLPFGSALGAKPAHIAAQVLADTGLLALAGALAGRAASIGMARGLYVLLPNFGAGLK